MQNPFESGHIRNYILFYVSIVVIMVLFFIASTLFYDVENIEAKNFPIENTLNIKSEETSKEEEKYSSQFKLIDTPY
jgi:hypothetical protein